MWDEVCPHCNTNAGLQEHKHKKDSHVIIYCTTCEAIAKKSRAKKKLEEQT